MKPQKKSNEIIKEEFNFIRLAWFFLFITTIICIFYNTEKLDINTYTAEREYILQQLRNTTYKIDQEIQRPKVTPKLR